MTKTWQTKKKILKLVSKDAKTPGEISDELGLAPSTVSEHIDELERMGAVRIVDNPFIKKWKYYKANPDFDVKSIAGLKRVSNIPQVAAALAVLLGVIAFFAFGVAGFGSVGTGHSVVFSLTDPPSVPNGTTSLNITYSSLRAHYIGSGNSSSAWVSGSGNGSLDLMSLINTSQVIGTGSVPANSMINIISFDISSAYIVINGTKYNVTVPSGNLTVPVTIGGRITSNSSLLIDLSPVVASIFTDNSTVFVLVPSAKAVVLGNQTERAQIGERQALTHYESEELNATTPSISITSESFRVVNNSTTQIGVTVKDNSNVSVTLRHVILNGVPDVVVSPLGANATMKAEIDAIPNFLPVMANTNETVQANANAGVDMGARTGTSVGVQAHDAGNVEGNDLGVQALVNGVHVRVFGNGSNINGSYGLDTADSAKLNSLVREGADVKSLRVLNFIVTSNGTLALPFLGAGASPEMQTCDNCFQNDSGYVLQAGSSVNLTFSGQIDYANGHIRVTPINGSLWELTVIGDGGAHTATNVTVTSG
ncbi:MAG: winged helix-turn-helix domain-containing protein [Candidatus Marsarchaeota archaeon]|nr:winged helix-turn-helix domain-containing protein [Candidatus Marsarchaeota archaeon]